jgi:hypothetical protein
MAFGTITSDNASFLLTVANVYPNGIPLYGFGVDDAFVAETAETAEIQVGVDGYGVMGYRPRSVAMSVRLLASSPSILVFQNWLAMEDQIGDKLPASAIIIIPSAGQKYTCANGALMRTPTMPPVRRVLGNMEWRIEWLPNGPGQPAISFAPA